jgi:hypothetical protein
MFEIQSSKIASAKLSGPEKEFADHMVADHSKTTNEPFLSGYRRHPLHVGVIPTN